MSKTTNVIIDIFNQENNLNNSRNCTCETETISDFVKEMTIREAEGKAKEQGIRAPFGFIENNKVYVF
jgi:hypothetical protein